LGAWQLVKLLFKIGQFFKKSSGHHGFHWFDFGYFLKLGNLKNVLVIVVSIV
jgi:hypothetical protein